MKSKPAYNSQAIMVEIMMIRINALLQKGDLVKLTSIASNIHKLIPAGKDHWFNFQEQYFLLSMHVGDYKKAFSILNSVKEQPRFNFLSKVQTEKWQIFEGYLSYIYPEVFNTQAKKKSFSVFKLINDATIYSMDKKGMNISLIILVVLHLLKAENYPQFFDKMDALRRYVYRHLKSPEYSKSVLFVKLLLLLEKHELNKVKIEKAAHSLLEKLNNQPQRHDAKGTAVEIVPYEKLWQQIFNDLPKSTSYSKISNYS